MSQRELILDSDQPFAAVHVLAAMN